MSDRQTQCQRILNLLQGRNGEEVSLTDILDLRIGQYNSRIKELRAEGHNIVNRTEWEGKTRKSWFCLVPKEQA